MKLNNYGTSQVTSMQTLLFYLRVIFVSLVAAFLVSGCASTSPGLRIDNIPMYGQPEIVRPEMLRQADELFIKTAVVGLGTREKASDAWWMQGEQFLAQDNLDFAMRRYNQAWLLNPNNFKAYWGFARVLSEREDPDSAFVYFDKALSLCTDDFQRPALLTAVGTAYLNKANRQAAPAKGELFRQADNFFLQATRMDPTYGNAFVRWAMSLYRQEKYSEAWAKITEARKQSGVSIPSAFLKALESKMAEPK